MQRNFEDPIYVNNKCYVKNLELIREHMKLEDKEQLYDAVWCCSHCFQILQSDHVYCTTCDIKLNGSQDRLDSYRETCSKFVSCYSCGYMVQVKIDQSLENTSYKKHLVKSVCGIVQKMKTRYNGKLVAEFLKGPKWDDFNYDIVNRHRNAIKKIVSQNIPDSESNYMEDSIKNRKLSQRVATRVSYKESETSATSDSEQPAAFLKNNLFYESNDEWNNNLLHSDSTGEQSEKPTPKAVKNLPNLPPYALKSKNVICNNFNHADRTQNVQLHYSNNIPKPTPEQTNENVTSFQPERSQTSATQSSDSAIHTTFDSTLKLLEQSIKSSIVNIKSFILCSTSSQIEFYHRFLNSKLVDIIYNLPYLSPANFFNKIALYFKLIQQEGHFDKLFLQITRTQNEDLMNQFINMLAQIQSHVEATFLYNEMEMVQHSLFHTRQSCELQPCRNCDFVSQQIDTKLLKEHQSHFNELLIGVSNVKSNLLRILQTYSEKAKYYLTVLDNNDIVFQYE
eukprot:NODE_16_length_49026_cov_1.035992.p6 type:complete len:508 gc:universal NODE_16_length_49026_cov_1.035992:20767-22290(+)